MPTLEEFQQAIDRVLAADVRKSLALLFGPDADSNTIGGLRRLFRIHAVLVHPDKNPLPGADKAFKVLSAMVEKRVREMETSAARPNAFYSHESYGHQSYGEQRQQAPPPPPPPAPPAEPQPAKPGEIQRRMAMRAKNKAPAAVQARFAQSKQSLKKPDIRGGSTFGHKVAEFRDSKSLESIMRELDKLNLDHFVEEIVQHATNAAVGGKIDRTGTFAFAEMCSELHQRYEVFLPRFRAKIFGLIDDAAWLVVQDVRTRGETVVSLKHQGLDKAMRFIQFVADGVFLGLFPWALLRDRVLREMLKVLDDLTLKAEHTERSLELVLFVLERCGIEVTAGLIAGVIKPESRIMAHADVVAVRTEAAEAEQAEKERVAQEKDAAFQELERQAGTQGVSSRPKEVKEAEAAAKAAAEVADEGPDAFVLFYQLAVHAYKLCSPERSQLQAMPRHRAAALESLMGLSNAVAAGLGFHHLEVKRSPLDGWFATADDENASNDEDADFEFAYARRHDGPKSVMPAMPLPNTFDSAEEYAALWGPHIDAEADAEAKALADRRREGVDVTFAREHTGQVVALFTLEFPHEQLRRLDDLKTFEMVLTPSATPARTLVVVSDVTKRSRALARAEAVAEGALTVVEADDAPEGEEAEEEAEEEEEEEEAKGPVAVRAVALPSKCMVLDRKVDKVKIKLHCIVRLANRDEASEGTRCYDVNFVPNDISYRRMQSALDAFPVIPQPLHDLLLGVASPAEARRSDFVRSAGAPPLCVPGSDNLRLNDDQQRAVSAAMGSHLAIVQGPPGTGKTTALTAIAFEMQRRYNDPVLLCAVSNAAVDELTRRLGKSGAEGLVRVPSSAVERDCYNHADVRPFTLLHYVRARVQDEINSGNDTEGTNAELSRMFLLWDHNKIDSVSQRPFEALRRPHERRVLQEARFVLTTCAGSADMRLNRKRFDAVLVDEAAQALEPECLIPIVRARPRSVVLVGDHCQLGPVVKARLPRGVNGLNRSLLLRLVELGHTVHQLTTQYRMHPTIAAFPSRAFYDDLLRNGCGAAERIPCGHLPWPQGGRAPIMFVHVNDAEAARAENGKSWMNEAEARVAIEHVRKLVKESGGSVSSSDVGVISPYAQQRGHIERSLHFYHSLYDVEVDTVERFQSREKDYIVMTGVRSEKLPRSHCPHHRARPNALACSPCGDGCEKACQGRLGFVADWRRLNVAITRARRGLIIVGNEGTLRVSPHWNALLNYIKDEGAIIRVDAPTLHVQGRGTGAWTAGTARTF